VSQALFRPNVSHDYDNGLADLLDVVGQNYRENEILAAHQQKPTRKILGTENTHVRSAWLALRDNAAYAGQFLWAGIDYLGESRAWPAISGFSGLLDRTGEIKPMGQERRSWWSATPMVHITRRVAARDVPPTDPGYEAYRRSVQTLYDDWTPPNAAAHEENVEVYSNCASVDLLLNGKSLGGKSLAADASPRNWRVTWEAGTLQAVCQNGAARDELRTAGKPAAVVLKVDRKGLTTTWDDVAYITAEVVDEHGVVVPSADNQITFHVTGPGEVVAVDNQDITSHEPFQGNVRSAFQGRCIAIVRANAAGRIALSANAASLKVGSATLEAK
jgi:beta-galactosidase